MALIVIDIGSDRYSKLLNDLVQIATIVLVTHYLMTLEYPNKQMINMKILESGKGLLSKNFINLLLYVLIGFITYDLVIKEVIIFE